MSTDRAPHPPLSSLAVLEWVRVAREAADAAAAVHHAWLDRIEEAGGREKGHRDFVSEVDLEAQEASLDVIRRAFPRHRILAEEGADGDEVPERSPGVPVWIVDPLDGTTNFLHRHPMFCASVGVALDGEVIAGAVSAAETGDRWWAGRGSGAFHLRLPPEMASGPEPPDARRLSTSRIREPAGALIGTGFPFKAPGFLPEYLPQLERILRATSGVRRGGSAAMDLCYLAQGSLDGFWESRLSPWDVAAGLVIVSEAGGSATRIGGGRIDPEEAGSILIGNGPSLRKTLDGILLQRTEGPG